jgi:hypothetical protein
MARRVVNRRELKAAAEAAEAARGKAARAAKASDPPRINPAFRPLKLDDSLLNTYFSWCPAEVMPEVSPLSDDPVVSGRLTLQMQRLGGLTGLWDLVGEVGWLVMEAAWIETDPREQYLICAALTFRGENPGRVIEPGHLWRLWQPSYGPRFQVLSNAVPLSEPMRSALDSTLATHLAESVKPWIERATVAKKGQLEWELNRLLARVAELDAERRSMRRLPRRDQSNNAAATRREIVDAEERIAALGGQLEHASPATPEVRRKRLCDIHWFVKGPEPREDAFGFPA